MIRRTVTALALCLVAGGCASVRSAGSRLPFVHHDEKVSDVGPEFQPQPHRQYFDKLHKRYYYYDPAKKAYFWENGQPKG